MPPLELTGERTLPDVPAENYWFRRHLAVYEWIAARVGRLRVLDMACGEGYGSDVLARSARERRRRRRQPRGLRARAAALPAGGTCASSAGWSRPTASPASSMPSCSCRRSSTSTIRSPCCEHFRALLAPGGFAYVSTPNVLTLAPPGRRESDNPWHLQEYRAEEFRELCRAAFDSVELLGLFHARKLRVHELALRLGWDAVHARLRDDEAVLRPLHAGDRDHATSRCVARDSTARSTSSPSAV